ncbi:MAG TPA: cytochrome b N-terminal domain-containing protein [Fimbriimonadaceae bacterium]|jgi:quinol-cytochrome oxidoreductase complex cytochrome b subunit
MLAKRIFNGLVATLLVVGLLEMVTGLILLPLYKPGLTTSYNSSKGLPTILESIHHWLSAILIVVGGLALLFGLYSSAYKLNSKKLWIGTLLLTLLAVFLQLTGHLLPWDVHAVRSAVIEIGIGGNVPVVGSAQGDLLRGGKTFGANTLQLWYWAHIAIFSLIWLGIGIFSQRKAKAVGYSSKALTIGAGIMVAAGLIFAIIAPVHLGCAATAGDFQNYTAKPEWYILPLHALLGIVQGINPSLAFVGTMVIPGIGVLLVALAPWLDKRAKEGKKSIYGPVLASIILIGGTALFISSMGDVASPNGPNNYTVAAQQTPTNQAALDPNLIAAGKQLFAQQGCADCHTINGTGGTGGPVLDGESTRHPSLQWQIDHLTKPTSVSSGSTMPAYANIGQTKLKDLAEYLETLK